MGYTRRDFIKESSAFAAMGLLGPRAGAQNLIRLAYPNRRLLPDIPVRDLTLRALDAAREAGATYADIRLDVLTQLEHFIVKYDAVIPAVWVDDFSYGIRVLAGGQWGFAGSTDPTTDGVARAAARAVAQAKLNAVGKRQPVELAPAPSVAGTWTTPIDIDPFEVGIDEQQDLMRAGTTAALAVKGIQSATVKSSFVRTVRTFASSEGSYVTQTLYVADCAAWAEMAEGGLGGVDAVTTRAKGWEIFRNSRLPDLMRQVAEQLVRDSRTPTRPIDVGRYDIVISPALVGSILQGTIGVATGADRALGKHQNTSGMSFAAPPEKVLGAMEIGSPLLTITADRSMPHGLATVCWDDEGVKPDEFTLVDHGVLASYQTTRESAAELKWWNAKRGQAVRSLGCARGGGLGLPTETIPNLTVTPGMTRVGAEDMIKDIKKGLYLTDGGHGSCDQMVMNCSWLPRTVQEIRNGRLVGHLSGCAIQFRTQQFWKSLDALGDASTIASDSYELDGLRTIRAVPARFRQIDVIGVGRAVS